MTKRNKSCESEVMLTMQRKELLKKSAIRYAEYYGMVEVQDALYADSASEKIFTNLISIIGSDANIKMAYRNLKSNKGSSTPGVDGKTFAEYLEDMAGRERQAEVGTVAELLEEIESENLYQVLVTVDGRTLKIVLLKMQGYSTKEIAPLVHLTTGAIYARLDHLRKKLRKIL